MCGLALAACGSKGEATSGTSDSGTLVIGASMSLTGKLAEITDLINRHGGSAVGLSGKDGGLILSKPLTARAWAESQPKGGRSR